MSQTLNPIPSVAGAADADPLVADDVLTEKEGFDLVGVLSTSDETAYTWDLATDRIEWESNAAAVFNVADRSLLDTGEKFSGMLAPEHCGVRNQCSILAPPPLARAARPISFNTGCSLRG